MILWAIKHKRLGYVNCEDNYTSDFNCVKTFRLKKDALADIKKNDMNADEVVEVAVKIEIKEIT
jgi:hypothetical protein